MTRRTRGQTMSDPDKITLDYLLVADGAQVVGGKLYLLGGGWDRLTVPQLPGGEFEVGRPTGLRSGTPQRFQLAGPTVPELPAAGRYVIQCAIDGEVIGHTAIEVMAASPT